MKKRIYLSFILFIGLHLPSKAQFNMFSVEDDVKFGLQVKEEIMRNPGQFPILSAQEYPKAYDYLYRITDKIIKSGELQYKDVFAWEVYIINDDSVLNAFATPGGYIYVYTGLIKYLDTEDQLVGVLGHEIAHADRRHSTRNISKRYGLSMGLGIGLTVLTGGAGAASLTGVMAQILADVAGNLISLGYSRGFESEADHYSVIYLSKTEYQCNGAAGFFEKLLAEGQNNKNPAFLSTHPSSSNRVREINKRADRMGCNKTPSNTNYQAFKDLLPK